MGAKIHWNRELEDSVIDWIASGKTLRAFGRVPGNPSHDAVYLREKKSPSFAQRIARAREIGQDVIAEECLEIMDDGSNDWMETEVGPRPNPETVNRSKLRVWGRLQLLAKWNPRKYGDKLQHSGDPDNPLVHEIRGGMKAAREALYGNGNSADTSETQS